MGKAGMFSGCNNRIECWLASKFSCAKKEIFCNIFFRSKKGKFFVYLLIEPARQCACVHDQAYLFSCFFLA